MQDKQLTVLQSRVQEAATSCPDAQRVLSKLFPEAFNDDDEGPLQFRYGSAQVAVDGNYSVDITVRASGDLHNRGLWLSPNYIWSIVKDNQGASVLTARKR
jgi:hypothetical protein